MPKIDEDIIEAASEWVVVLGEPDVTDQMRLDFKAWLKEDPAHEVAYERVSQRWKDLDLVLNAESSREFESEAKRSVFQKLQSSGLVKSAVGGVAAASIAIVFFYIRKPDNNFASYVLYETAIGEVDSVLLPDESTMFVNSGTRVQISYSDLARTAVLLSGEAHFDVMTDADRPFSVVAGDRVVQAIGTEFSVRQSSEGVRVTVSEGSVLLRDGVQPELIEQLVERQPFSANSAGGNIADSLHADMVATETILRAGDQVDVVEDSLVLVSDIPEAKIERELAWRHGGLIFDRDSLEHVVSVMGRYTDADIVISDPELAELEVGGYFQIDDIDVMLNLLEAGLEVDVERIDEKSIEIRRR